MSKWQLSEHVMVNCGEDCNACNYCDECNNNVASPGLADKCPCGTNLNTFKGMIITGPADALYCSKECCVEYLTSIILSYQEVLGNLDAFIEEVTAEDISLAPPVGTPWRKNIEYAMCGRPETECRGCTIKCERA